MPEDHGVDRAPEAWHTAVEHSLERFDREHRLQWKARFAAGGRILCPIFLCNETPESRGVLAFNLEAYDWIPDETWTEFGANLTLENIATVTGQSRAAGSEDLVPQMVGLGGDDVFNARLIGMGFAGPEYKMTHNPGCAEYDVDDERLSYSFYVAFTSGNCYVRRFMGTDAAENFRGFFDPMELNPDVISEQIAEGRMGETHLALYDLLVALRCSLELARAHYGQPSGDGGAAWLKHAAGQSGSSTFPSVN